MIKLCIHERNQNTLQYNIHIYMLCCICIRPPASTQQVLFFISIYYSTISCYPPLLQKPINYTLFYRVNLFLKNTNRFSVETLLQV